MNTVKSNFLKVSEVISLSNCMLIAKQAYIVQAKGQNLILRLFLENLNDEWIKRSSIESLMYEDLSLFVTDMNLDVETQVLKIYKNTKSNKFIDIKVQLDSSLPQYWAECFSDSLSALAA